MAKQADSRSKLFIIVIVIIIAALLIGRTRGRSSSITNDIKPTPTSERETEQRNEQLVPNNLVTREPNARPGGDMPPAKVPNDGNTAVSTSASSGFVSTNPEDLPPDLREQLLHPPTTLPADLEAQLHSGPAEIPEDIKRALSTPPRTVTIDEVNNPNWHDDKNTPED